MIEPCDGFECDDRIRVGQKSVADYWVIFPVVFAGLAFVPWEKSLPISKTRLPLMTVYQRLSAGWEFVLLGHVAASVVIAVLICIGLTIVKTKFKVRRVDMLDTIGGEFQISIRQLLLHVTILCCLIGIASSLTGKYQVLCILAVDFGYWMALFAQSFCHRVYCHRVYEQP